MSVILFFLSYIDLIFIQFQLNMIFHKYRIPFLCIVSPSVSLGYGLQGKLHSSSLYCFIHGWATSIILVMGDAPSGKFCRLTYKNTQVIYTII